MSTTTLLADYIQDVKDKIKKKKGIQKLDFRDKQVPQVPIELNDVAMYIQRANFKGNLIVDFSNLPLFNNLLELNLGANHLTSFAPEILSLGKLEKLLVNENELTELPKDLFIKLNKLVSFVADDNKITALPEDIGNGKLKHLNMHNNALTIVPKSYNSLKLEIFSVSRNKLDSAVWDIVLPKDQPEKAMVSLQYLSVWGNDLQYVPDSICLLQNLKGLDVPHGNIVYFPIESVAKLKHLEKLLLNDNDIPDAQLRIEYLEPLKNLEELDMRRNPQHVTMPTKSYLDQTFPKMKEFRFSCIDEILPNLYLGCFESTLKSEYLNQQKITHVVNCCSTENPSMNHPNRKYLDVPLLDHKDFSIIEYIPKCNAFIEEAIQQGGTVLVHCFAGKSRSASMLCAYLMERDKSTYNATSALIHNKRIGGIKPNVGFVQQLQSIGSK